jgi:3-oxoacyl-[acyl-carrier protein] reductase
MPASTPAARTVALFGASGSIGQALVGRFLARGDRVLAFSRRGAAPEGHRSAATWLAWDAQPAAAALEALRGTPVAAVVWAQGQNCTDSIRSFDEQVHRDLYEANVLFVLRSLHELLQRDLLAKPARLCIVSSIWQDIARPNKLSYSVSKAALRGLVQSIALDLGAEGHLVNAVLPGALDTPMTRSNLKPEQIDRLAAMTPLARLPALDDVCATVDYLCAPSNNSVTGQFVAVDGGFSHAKFL